MWDRNLLFRSAASSQFPHMQKPIFINSRDSFLQIIILFGKVMIAFKINPLFRGANIFPCTYGMATKSMPPSIDRDAARHDSFNAHIYRVRFSLSGIIKNEALMKINPGKIIYYVQDTVWHDDEATCRPRIPFGRYN